VALLVFDKRSKNEAPSSKREKGKQEKSYAGSLEQKKFLRKSQFVEALYEVS
jgi:hypothetical protein